MTTQHVFLSYFREDREEARKLRDDLQREGIDVWWDGDDILAGKFWKDEIHKAIEDSSAFVLCLSQKGVAKTKSGIYPEAANAIAIYREYRPGEIFLIPVRFSECKIPDLEIESTKRLGDLQHVDLFPPDERERGVTRLLDSLREVSSRDSGPMDGSNTSTLQNKRDIQDGKDSTKPKMTVVITINCDLEQFKKKGLNNLLLCAIADIFGDDISDLNYSIQPGSVRLILELSPVHAHILLWAISAGKFEKYGVVDARLEEGYEPAEKHNTSRDDASFKVDVLILGGGALGLWTLRRLRQENYNAYLVDIRNLGSAQTGHAQWYLHQGYNLTREAVTPEGESLIGPLRYAAKQWNNWIEGLPINPPTEHVYFLYRHYADSRIRKESWEDKNLDVVHLHPFAYPSWLPKDSFPCVYQSEEKSLSAEEALGHLLAEGASYASRIDEVVAIQEATSDDERHRVVLRAGDEKGRKTFTMEAHTLILAAGTGNEVMVKELGQEAGLHRSKECILVLEAPTDHLPAASVVWPYTGLQIIPRVQDQRTLWLVTVPFASLPDPRDDEQMRLWVKRLYESLALIFPPLKEDPSFQDALRAGVLAPWRTECARYVQQLSAKGGGMYALYANLLSLAPYVTFKFFEQAASLKRSDPDPSAHTGWQEHFQVPLEVLPEPWDEILMPWSDFAEKYL